MKKENLSLEEQAKKLLKLKGNTKGSEFLTLAAYIRQKYGEEKLRLLEKKMKELGCPLSFGQIKPMEWYPENLSVLSMIVAKQLFNWKDLFELGYESPKFSIGVRLFMKISSPEVVFNECSKSWRRFLDCGNLEPYQYNEKENYAILHLKNYSFHPEMCQYYAGFFLRIFRYVRRAKESSIEEKKCIFKGDPYHEYIIRWS